MDPQSNPPQIDVQNVSFAYFQNNWIFRNVSMQIHQGDIISLAGPSGSGKSTFGYLLKGLIPHSIRGTLEGNIFINTLNLRTTKIATLAKTVGMVFQDLNAQLFSTTVREEIEFGLNNLGLDRKNAIDAMASLDISPLAEFIPMNLSAGQKQRVILASVIAMKPQILILDEPSAHLDPQGRRRLRDWLAQLNQTYHTTIIFLEQDPWLAGELAHRFFLVKDHNITEIPKSKMIAKQPTWEWIAF